MHNRSDQFSKSVLRDTLNRASTAETEVEVLAATQKIDVYSVPDPTREAERAEMGLLGELSAEPSIFEPYHSTPGLRQVRHCLRKQLTWHHEIERRARAAARASSQDADADADAPPQPAVPFPALVVISPGRPATALEAFGCKPVSPGVYHGVPGLVLRVVVLSELPRTRDTLLLRLLGSARVLRDALEDLAALPKNAWEGSIATPLLVHFRIGADGQAADEEDEVSAEIRAWYEKFEKQLRDEGRDEGRKEGASHLLLRLLRARFGELPAAVVARIEAAEEADIEQWAERVLDAQTLAEVFAKPS